MLENKQEVNLESMEADLDEVDQFEDLSLDSELGGEDLDDLSTDSLSGVEMGEMEDHESDVQDKQPQVEEVGDAMIAGLGEGDIVDAGDEAGAAFEEAFGADIDSHSEHGEFEDENEDDREEALSILESTGEIDDHTEENFDEDALDDLGDDFEEDLGLLEHDLEEVGFGEDYTKTIKPRDANAISSGTNFKTWDLAGFDFTENGLSLEFANGAKIDLSTHQFGEGTKTLNLGENTLVVSVYNGELRVSHNGVSISFPLTQAA